MNKFNVGDILRSIEPNITDSSKYVYVLILDWTDRNEYATPIYTVFNFNRGVKHCWNSNHVEGYYERAS